MLVSRPWASALPSVVTGALGSHADFDFSGVMGPDMAIGSSLGPGTTMATSGSTGLQGRHDPNSDMSLNSIMATGGEPEARSSYGL